MVRLIKLGQAVELLPPPTSEEEVKICPTCQSPYCPSPGKVQRVSYRSCGHLTCLDCLVKAKRKCDQCPAEETTIVSSSSLSTVPVENRNGNCRPSSERATVNGKRFKLDVKEDNGKEAAVVENGESNQTIQKRGRGRPRVHPKKLASDSKRKSVASNVSDDNLCTRCNLSFSKREDLGVHYSKIHADTYRYPCDICQWPFKTRNHLVYHRKTHTRGRPFKCKICMSGYDRKCSLQRHMIRVHLVNIRLRDIKPVKNPDVEELDNLPPLPLAPIPFEKGLVDPTTTTTSGAPDFRKRKGLKSRNRAVLTLNLLEQTKRNGHNCQHCTKIFSIKMNLGLHLRRSHGGILPHACDLCFWPFETEDKLRRHRITHTFDRPFRCVMCESTFNRKDSLEQHIRIMHLIRSRSYESSKLMAYKKNPLCSYCKESFKERTELARHLNQCHSDRRPFPCERCEWPFKTKKLLRAHKETHTDERPYKCDLCNLTFLRKYGKEKHMFRIHYIQIRLQDDNQDDGYCPECQTAFDPGEDGKHRKVAYSKCEHFCCLDCVIKAELGCGQCTTAANASVSPIKNPILASGSKSSPSIIQTRKSKTQDTESAKALAPSISEGSASAGPNRSTTISAEERAEENHHSCQSNANHDDQKENDRESVKDVEEQAEVQTTPSRKRGRPKLVSPTLQKRGRGRPSLVSPTLQKRGRGRPSLVSASTTLQKRGRGRPSLVSAALKKRGRGRPSLASTSLRKHGTPSLVSTTLKKRGRPKLGSTTSEKPAVHKKKTKEVWICNICNAKYKQKNHLSLHMIKKHGNVHLSFKCYRCRVSFETKLERQKHRDTEHEDKGLKCGLCDTVFTKEFTLRRHLAKVHGRKYNRRLLL